jgi:hypothetical protein
MKFEPLGMGEKPECINRGCLTGLCADPMIGIGLITGALWVGGTPVSGTSAKKVGGYGKDMSGLSRALFLTKEAEALYVSSLLWGASSLESFFMMFMLSQLLLLYPETRSREETEISSRFLASLSFSRLRQKQFIKKK